MKVQKVYKCSGGLWTANLVEVHWRQAQEIIHHPAVTQGVPFHWNQFSNKLEIFLEAGDEADADLCITWITEDVLEANERFTFPNAYEKALNEALNRPNTFTPPSEDDDLPAVGSFSWLG